MRRNSVRRVSRRQHQRQDRGTLPEVQRHLGYPPHHGTSRAVVRGARVSSPRCDARGGGVSGEGLLSLAYIAATWIVILAVMRRG